MVLLSNINVETSVFVDIPNPPYLRTTCQKAARLDGQDGQFPNPLIMTEGVVGQCYQDHVQ